MIYDEIYHHGIKGMRWGIRRFQNRDGSLTDRGQRHREIRENRDTGNSSAKKGLSKGVKIAIGVGAVVGAAALGVAVAKISKDYNIEKKALAFALREHGNDQLDGIRLAASSLKTNGADVDRKVRGNIGGATKAWGEKRMDQLKTGWGETNSRLTSVSRDTARTRSSIANRMSEEGLDNLALAYARASSAKDKKHIERLAMLDAMRNRKKGRDAK